MQLGKHVVDKDILDKNGVRAGKVDDLLLDFGEPGADGRLPDPVVEAIITGPMTLSRYLWRWVGALARSFYRLCGLKDPRPTQIPWRAVTEINVVVYVDINRDETSIVQLQQAAERRFIDRLPGS